MDLIDPLWSFAPEWKLRLLALATLANMVLAIHLYMVMSTRRIEAVKAGRVTTETYRATQNEPEDVAVFNRAVQNQFESPVLFYALVGMSLALGVSSWLTVLLAVLYVVLRWAHAREMTGRHMVLNRRRIFIRSITVLMVMMAEFAVSVLLRV